MEERKTNEQIKREETEKIERFKQEMLPFGQLEEESKKEYVERIRKELKGPKVHSVIIQKGGTGKTTSSSNLALSLSNMGFDVLLIDSDSQASLTVLVNEFDEDVIDQDVDSLEPIGLSKLYFQLINEEPISDDLLKEVITRPKYKKYETVRVTNPETGKRMLRRESTDIEFGFDFIAGDISLADAEIFLATSKDRNVGIALTTIIQRILQYKYYDFIIVDCAPGLSTLSYSAIAASSSGIIVPLNLEVMAIAGCRNLIGMTANIQTLLKDNFGIDHYGVLGIVINEYVPRLKYQRSLDETVKRFMPVERFIATIPSKSACDSAHLMGRLYQQDSAEAKEAFDLLAKEVVERDIANNYCEPSIIGINDLGRESLKVMKEGEDE